MIPLQLDPADDLAAQNAKLRRITSVLMSRVEQELAQSGPGYANFQLAAALEEQVRVRTRELDNALKMLSISNARLTAARQDSEQARVDLYESLEAMREGFALFDPQDALVMCNSRFSAHFPDVARRLGPGLRFADYVGMVSRSPHLELGRGETPADWARERLQSHAQPHVNFTLRVRGGLWLQVGAQRTPTNGTAIVQTDVTEMILGEREVRDRLLDDQARLIRATLDHITQGVAIFDAGHRLAGGNQRLRQLVALPVHLLRTGTEFRAILAYLCAMEGAGPADPLQALARWADLPPDRPPLTIEIRRGNGMILELASQQMPDRGFVVSFTDMTAERQAAAAMHRANATLEERVAARTRELEQARDLAEKAHASKSRFVAGASHDLLQPLNAAKLFLSSLSLTRLDADQRVIASRIQSAFDSVESILGALLDISNLDMGAAKADVARIPLAPLLRSIAQQFQPLADERGLGFRVVPSRLWVESDPAYLRRIVQNLVVNALRYTARGKVLVGVRRRSGLARIDVFDTGPGIPAERRADIFCEFVRLDANPGVPQGMGLGLAIVDRACALLNHRLDLASEPGRGTQFSVTLPIADAGAAARARLDQNQIRPTAPLDDMIVLVIETDDAVRAGMVSVLEDWGASPLVAPDLAAAEALVADIGVAPDIIIADTGLAGGMGGIEAIARLRAQHGAVPAIAVSADRSPGLRRRAREAEVTLLHKPLELQRLRAVLQWVKNRDIRPGA